MQPLHRGLKRQGTVLAPKPAMLVGDGHGRVDGAERCAHDAHAHGRNLGLNQTRPRAGKIAARRFVRIRKVMTGRQDNAVERALQSPAHSGHEQPIVAGSDIRDLG